jgi:hypothetical protein
MLDKDLIALTVDLLVDEILYESYGLELCSPAVHNDKLLKSIAYREYSLLDDCTYDAVELSTFSDRYTKNTVCITKVLK